MATTEFYEMFFKMQSGAGFAAPVDASRLDDYALRNAGDVETWETWEFNADFPHARDLLQTVASQRVYSDRFRELLNAYFGPGDRYQWLPCEVSLPDTTTRKYWLLHFPVGSHVPLDPTYSTFGPSGIPIRWVLDRAALEGRRIFAPARIHGPIVVHSDVAEEIRAQAIVGVDFARARVG